MPDEESVSRWLPPLRAGDESAARQLWQRYFPRLVALARRKLRDAPRRAADEEDVALSAFDSLQRGLKEGRFPDVVDRDGLWRLLVVFTARKAGHLLRDEAALKRGGGQSRECADALLGVIGGPPTPAFAAEVAEEYRRLMGLLADPALEAVAVARMEGHSVEQIAGRSGYSPRSVKRKLQLIRTLWAAEAPA